MEFNIKQKNCLLTGVILACEVESSEAEIRTFLTVSSFKKGINNECIPWDNVIKSFSEDQNIIFTIHYYSLKASYIEYGYDIHENDLIQNNVIENICGWDNVYKELAKIIDDFSVLRPQWNCDNPLD